MKRPNTISGERKRDDVFMRTTAREDILTEKVADVHKCLQEEIETFFDNLKHCIDIDSVRHFLEHRVRILNS